FLGLTPETYTFQVTDDNGCVYTENYTVPDVTPINVVGNLVSNITCDGDSDGEIRYTVSGFAGNFSYDVVGTSGTVDSGSGVTTTPTNIAGLAADTYTITVTDDVTGCEDTAFIVISGPPSPLALTQNSITPMTCANSNTGAVNYSATGGWGGSAYTLTLPGGGTTGPQGSGVFTGLTLTGTYTISVEDANGCIVDDTF